MLPRTEFARQICRLRVLSYSLTALSHDPRLALALFGCELRPRNAVTVAQIGGVSTRAAATSVERCGHLMQAQRRCAPKRRHHRDRKRVPRILPACGCQAFFPQAKAASARPHARKRLA